ncbi:DUF6959 family protein [Streptomyces nigra]
MPEPSAWEVALIVAGSGVLMQGDCLHVLRSDLAEVIEACGRGDLAGARDSVGLLLMSLDVLLKRYEDALQQHEIRRPY